VNLDLAKRPRATVASIVFVIILAGSAVWWGQQQAATSTKLERQLRARLAQWRALSGSQPAPVSAVAEALAVQVAKARRTVNSLRQLLGASGKDPVRQTTPPEQRADAFFAIARFMEEQRSAASRTGVPVPETETFSFSAHRNSGPADEHIALVHRQTLVVTRLLNLLWQTRPVSLIAVQRENPSAKVDTGNKAITVSREGRPEDWFEWPSSRSLARDGIVDTLAFRIGFVGRTATLRGFLAGISAADVPLVVREVSVQPLGSNGQAPGGRRTLEDLFRDEPEPGEAAGESSNTVSIIPANDAEFSVTIEYLDLVGPMLARAAELEEEDGQ
tara:strand:+ start:2142 stop:3134 length:993 start_codon:yes stop_codon:yes gene_type:complete